MIRVHVSIIVSGLYVGFHENNGVQVNQISSILLFTYKIFLIFR